MLSTGRVLLLSATMMLLLDSCKPPEVSTMLKHRTEESLSNSGTPRDIMLNIERRSGITDCFLADSRRKHIGSPPWEMIKCNRDYAVFTATDRIGEFGREAVSRQPAILTVSGLEYARPIMELMTKRSKERLDDKASEAIKSRFNVARAEPVSVSGFVDSTGVIHGSVSISAGPTNLCEFRYPDLRYPQTTCFAVTDNLVFQLETNSTDYEAIQGTLEALMLGEQS